jgi:hypothetical protein
MFTLNEGRRHGRQFWRRESPLQGMARRGSGADQHCKTRRWGKIGAHAPSSPELIRKEGRYADSDISEDPVAAIFAPPPLSISTRTAFSPHHAADQAATKRAVPDGETQMKAPDRNLPRMTPAAEAQP